MHDICQALLEKQTELGRGKNYILFHKIKLTPVCFISIGHLAPMIQLFIYTLHFCINVDIYKNKWIKTRTTNKPI